VRKENSAIAKKNTVSQSQKLAYTLAELTLSKKADDVKILDLRKLTGITDFFVICTAYSDTQVKAIADAVIDGAKKMGENVWHKEGMSLKSWVLLDYVDVVVHIFLKDVRKFYGLEKLWGDADMMEVKD
jgi:ribosome-associated protein